MAETAATVATYVSVLEVIGCFAMGKTISSMWFLINTAQFLIYMGFWNVYLSPRCRISFTQLRTIALGEFMDRIDLSGLT